MKRHSLRIDKAFLSKKEVPWARAPQIQFIFVKYVPQSIRICFTPLSSCRERNKEGGTNKAARSNMATIALEPLVRCGIYKPRLMM